MTLTELLAFPSAEGIKTVLLSFLQRTEFPITDWESGGVVRTQVELESAVISDLLDAIAVQVAGGFLDSSDTDWLTIMARGWYERDRVAAVAAQQTVVLACDASHGPYVITTANVLLATDGARYFPLAGGTLATGGTLSINAVAESPGAARGLITALSSALAGVTVSSAVITGTNFGVDEERDASVAKRCDARWPSFEVDPTGTDRTVKWAKAASAEITRVRLDNDPANAGGVLVTVAGSGGPVTAGAVTAAQVYFDARAPITDLITAQNSSALSILAGGTVTVPAALATQIKAAADAAWISFLATTAIGGLVRLSRLIQVVMDAGAIDFPDATLNGGVGDVSLATSQVPVPDVAGPLSTILFWKPI